MKHLCRQNLTPICDGKTKIIFEPLLFFGSALKEINAENKLIVEQDKYWIIPKIYNFYFHFLALDITICQ